MTAPREVAEAFSRHRFRDVYPVLAPDVVWTAVGSRRTVGRDAVVGLCEQTLAALAGTRVEFTRFVLVADGDAAACDVVARYTDPGGTSVVASCDVYEFRDGALAVITSYDVELETPG
ncbi:Limonene-1,2-epoxide hydrolase [Geodermatophilus saharensis]|uniref:Limonene-1,2-epoxide hydrolase n=1 Tax=Geodermatophilus saharensis TaxID=1137994 RepID=A0A239HSB2_9ACTN|nr:nuclear transport factor 2 family protein [Geodermatophilus saharensis]SNS83174.1 Limonene-1,2-epoxide hydrolase [Geodermatophilus saharensis]